MNEYDRLCRYYYAVGYYDGRAHGSFSNILDLLDKFKPYYEEGYWAGVTDYTEYDAPKMAGG